MATSTDSPAPLSVVRRLRQLRRTRASYAVGLALWAVSTAWTGWESPGSRQMWVSVLLLSVFAALLLMTSLWTRRLEKARPAGPAHHAAPRPAVVAHHAGT
ncbi:MULTISPECIES: hypothetical protein [unclassified Streptomyces]|uniref:hypothetical protein n=1 Tax=unclassified Streptomyces TaxID=2593676 RepID=UPI0036587874